MKLTYLTGILIGLVVLLGFSYYISLPSPSPEPVVEAPAVISVGEDVVEVVVEKPITEEIVVVEEAIEEVSETVAVIVDEGVTETSPSFSVVEVMIETNFFNPLELTVKKGTTVRWVNDETKPHKIVAYDRSFFGPRINPGDVFEHTFNKVGTFAYFDSIFPKTFKGTIIVVD